MKPTKPVFLARQGYRLRRVMDMARLLPVVGAFLVLLPILWASKAGEPGQTSGGVVYVFVVWAGLIVVAAVLAQVLGSPRTEDQIDEQGEGRE